MPATWMKSIWRQLTETRPMMALWAVVSAVVLGVLGNGVYDCIKTLGQEEAPPPAPVTVRKPVYEGYEIQVQGRKAMLVTETADLDTARSFAVHAAFGTQRAPPLQAFPGDNVIRILQVYVVNQNENTSFSSPGCWNTYLVSITAEVSGPDFAPGAASGKAQRCADNQSMSLKKWIDEDVIPEAVAKLRQKMRLASPGPAEKLIDEAAAPTASNSGPKIAACFPCWLWSQGCKALR